MAKYLTREQVVANFKVNYIPVISDASLEVKKDCWRLLLDALFDEKKISFNQKNTWKFPKKELDL